MLERACHLLCQLPATAIDKLEALPFDTASLRDYQLQASESDVTGDAVLDIAWSRLRVTHHVSDLVLRYALHKANYDLGGRAGNRPITAVVDAILILLKAVLEISGKESSQDPSLLIVCAYIWTSWQRCSMLELWSQMKVQLDRYNYENNHSLCLKGIELIPEIHDFLDKQNSQKLRHTSYLCGWSLRSLGNDRASILMDLRHFHHLYHAQFGSRPPICNPGPTQCNGNSSQDCKRFKNTETKNQSMHDYRCDGSCKRLFWSRDSFIGVSGARAVDITSTDGEFLRYCKVNESTLAISHVWSHGQGGRPDRSGPEGTGFNQCLHRRYAYIAASLDCDAYWMDTPCIPSEKDLRWECIPQINSIFATSAKTLVCDGDIMAIDMSGHTMHAYELILATLLVCDWSVRAWTLLEAMRGRCSLFILCLHNQVISLEELLRSVHAAGRIDLIILFLGRDYLFPPMAIAGFELFPGKPITSEIEQEIQDGFLSIGEAAALLSHRHATRDGDDLLIWSLLIGDVADKSPVDMWRRQIGKSINTGSLISSARRVQGHLGLSWAPYLPTVLQHNQDPSNVSKVYPAYDGSETFRGKITKQGLRAKWLVHRVPDLVILGTPRIGLQSSIFSAAYSEIANQYLNGFEYGALLQPLPRTGPRNMAPRYRGVLGHVMVICGSHDGTAWEWIGIYE